MLFPMCIALGADLFDSAAYALFAKDGRLLSEEGTYRIESMVEWPTQSSHISTYTPAQVRAMRKPERTSLLARHNLEVTQRELARCREAVREWVNMEHGREEKSFITTPPGGISGNHQRTD